MRLSTEAAALQLPRSRAWRSSHAPGYHSGGGRSRPQSESTQRQITRVAKRSVGIRGRSIVAMLLGTFVVVTLTVVWRRSIGISESRTIQQLDRRRSELTGERARLESELRDLTSRQRLGPVVEQRLGMHVPAGRQVVILSRQAKRVAP